MSFLLTLTAASAALNLNTLAAAQPLSFLGWGTNAPTGSTDLGDQLITVHVTSDNIAEAGTLWFVLYDPNNGSKVVTVKATLSVTANRSNFAGSAANNYVCDVVFPDLTNKLDLNGLQKGVTAYANGVSGAVGTLPLQWYVVCGTLTGTQLNVWIHPSRAI